MSREQPAENRSNGSIRRPGACALDPDEPGRREQVNHYAMDPLRRSFDIYDGALKLTAGSSDREKTYEMPDGNVFNIDNERFRCAEVLFQPRCIGKEASGIHDKSLQSIMTFDEVPYKTGWESSGSDGVKAAEAIQLKLRGSVDRCTD